MALDSGLSFLTSLSKDTKAAGKQQKREQLLDGAKKGDEILKLHSDLQQLAEELDDKVEEKLSNNEKAFFAAYRSHMFTVQKDFKELKQKADEEKTKIRRDAKIQSLEKELSWFTKEALRLDEQCKKYKKDLDKWKGRAEALEDDRQFLENQIKGAKRHNKTLRGAVEKAQTSAYSVLVSIEEGKQTPQPQQEALMNQEVAAIENVPDAQGASNGLSAELEQRYQSCVKRLKQQLESEQKLAAKMRAVSDHQFDEPSELESFFLQCIDKVKAEIVQRKKDSKEEHKQMSGSIRQLKAMANQKPDPEPVVNIDTFTVADRRKVVELLLSSEQVLQFLYDKLFPSGAP